MSPRVRVAFVGSSDECAAVGRGLGERVTLTPVAPDEVADSAGVDCVLCVGSFPEGFEGSWPPTVVLTDDEDDARAARLAGVRVLPTDAAGRPEVLRAQIEAEADPGHETADDHLARAMIDTVTDVVYAFDGSGFTHWNDRLSEVTGLVDEQLASMHPVDLFDDEEADRIAAIIDDCNPEELPITIEAELPGPDGRSRPYEFTSSRLVDDGETIGICGIGRDVTEFKRTEWTLEHLLEATRDLMAAEGKTAVANVTVSAADRVLGLTHTGIHLVDSTGDRLEPIAYTDTVEASLGTVPTLERDESLAWEVFESGEDRVFEGVHEEEGAHNPETHLRTEMIFSLGDHGVLIIASDSPDAFDDADVYFAKLLAATATVALDRAAREGALEEKNARLEEFVGVVSHDLRNPLTVAEGSVSLARETGDDSHLDQVSESHRRMREIIEGLLVLAREGKAVGETRPVILGTVAEEAWANVGTGDSTLVVGDDRTVHADRNRLTQLFENAFRNSVEHAGPDVTITVEATPTGFVIDDDGHGIPEDERETALEPGYSTDEGTGFGLVIMQNIAEGHSWGLSLAESDAGGLRIEITTDGKGHSAGGR
ncbi:ATP-binding protein [Halalkalicoccus sp. NIPERK01]|uniref:PAS domain-containing sensor histidine kinase n=1 Tax=Halalkalicoccus sp. NIPERK01 TaxID=3053469 RepID=UPI00256F328E|nr:ATP-binding protein [Halalkalicoccus sp. NIPERK01]MDL5360958.1 PAS domain S-box protein [Halalkalicoccus sp. NIPERK01]